jgi:hypothetical protein
MATASAALEDGMCEQGISHFISRCESFVYLQSRKKLAGEAETAIRPRLLEAQHVAQVNISLRRRNSKQKPVVQSAVLQLHQLFGDDYGGGVTATLLRLAPWCTEVERDSFLQHVRDHLSVLARRHKPFAGPVGAGLERRHRCHGFRFSLPFSTSRGTLAA